MLGVHVIGDYMKMLQYLKRLDKINKKKDYYLKLYRDLSNEEIHDQTKIPRKITGRLCFKKPGPALKDYYGQRPFTLKKEMKKEKKNKDKTNFGVAFIVMNQLSSVEDLIKNLKPLKKKFKQNDPVLYKKLDATVSIQSTGACV